MLYFRKRCKNVEKENQIKSNNGSENKIIRRKNTEEIVVQPQREIKSEIGTLFTLFVHSRTSLK